MSQSPVNDLSERASLRYRQGWRALNRLLHEDRSFSGRERNSAFLNLGGERAAFATASAVTGFDFPDDARGLATVDWDFDGDLDVWLTNRTAPRVRFLENRTSGARSVAFKLLGDGRRTNRDAIGARLELHVDGDARSPVRLRSLRGGDGFLSQSSAWVSFGLGPSAMPVKLVVRWPGGGAEEFRGMAAGGFYKVGQGSGVLQAFAPPRDRVRLPAAVPEIPVAGEAARIVVPPGLPVPTLALLAEAGGPSTWEPTPGRPALINLWATWCAPCLTELAEWTARRDALTAAGLDVIALNTDALGPEPVAEAGAPAAALRKIDFPFATRRLALAGLHALDHLNRAVLDRWKPLPLPTSFLIDARGELAVIYKGPVSAATVVSDLKLAAAGPEARRAAATPLAGRWLDEAAGTADPKRVAALMLDHDEADAAIAYLDRCLRLLEGRPPGSVDPRQAADLRYLAGVLQRDRDGGTRDALVSLRAARDLNPQDVRVRRELAQALFSAGQAEAAAVELRAAISLNPSDRDARHELADLSQRLGRLEEARTLLQDLVKEDPRDGVTRYRLAGVLVAAGDAAAAVSEYKQALTDTPRLLEAAHDLARLLATHPDPAVRAPDEALALADRLCSLTRNQNPQFLDTLGLAWAGKEDFAKAADAARQALALTPADQTQVREARQQQLSDYESRLSPPR